MPVVAIIIGLVIAVAAWPGLPSARQTQFAGASAPNEFLGKAHMRVFPGYCATIGFFGSQNRRACVLVTGGPIALAQMLAS